jgi:hypothetical protein
MVAAAGLLFLFLVVAAVAIEVGMWLHAKRDAQNDVDASVLAGAQELPDEAVASAMAEAWGARNGTTDGELVCCEFEDLSDDGAADLIRARVERQPDSLAGNLLDVGIITVTTRAAAAKQRAVAACVIPWAIAVGEDNPGPAEDWGLLPEGSPETLFAFHTSEFTTPGNFGSLALYGNGAVAYREAIATECGNADSVCDQLGDPAVPIGGTLDCDVQTGAMGQNTHQALTDRDILYKVSDCDVESYTDAEEKAGEKCGNSRAVLIPIIDTFPSHGHDSIDILGIATFYIAGWDRSGPWGDQDMDGDTIEDMVWGYFLEDQDVIEAWNIQWGYSDDPFAPTRVLLVE